MAREQMDAVLDGLLSGSRADRVRSHIADCPDCGPEFAARRELQVALRTLPAEPLPEGFEMRLHRRLAAVGPEPRRARWWGTALPAATAVAGFLAAAAVAAPLMGPGGAQHAASYAAASAVTGAAKSTMPVPIEPGAPSLDQRSGGPGGYAAAGASTAVINGPAGSVYDQEQPNPGSTGKAMAPMQRAAGPAASLAPAASATTGAAGSTFATTTPATATAPGSATTSPAADPAALSLTILATQPMQAVADLSQIAAEGGGHVIATFPAHSDEPSPQGAPQPVATLDALIPASSADAYARRAGNDGKILASVSSLPPVVDGSAPNVRLLVTVLAAPTPAPTSQQGPAPKAAQVRPAGGTVSRAVVQDAARAAPWAAGVAVIGLLSIAAGRFARRP